MSSMRAQGSVKSCPLFRHAIHLPAADIQQIFNRLAVKQAAQSKTQLCDLQAKLLGPQGTLAKFVLQIAREGRNANALGDLPDTAGTQHRQLAEDAADFLISVRRQRKLSDNPFKGLSRLTLCCILFDDTAPYVLAEQFAASEALRHLDSQYFATLIGTTRHTVERRLVFTGLLEHFDSLLPIEQSIYPLDYRTVQQGHLNREESLYGPLNLDKPVSQLLQDHSAQWLLENLRSSEGSNDSK